MPFELSEPSVTRMSCVAMPKRSTEPNPGNKERCAAARIEVTRRGLDIHIVVTNLVHGSPEWVYDGLYCARGQAENLILLCKTKLCSDRTSCRLALANHLRLRPAHGRLLVHAFNPRRHTHAA